MSDEFGPPEAVEGIDYYTEELESHLVTIHVEVTAIRGEETNAAIRLKAVEGFKTGKLDGSTEIIFTKKIKDVKLCGEHGVPFDLAEWQKEKCAEQGLNVNGQPLRAHEIPRPTVEKTLTDFSETLNKGATKESGNR